MQQTHIDALYLPELNRRKYERLWGEIENLPESEVLMIDGNGTRADAKRVRAALQSMARWRNRDKLTTSIEVTGENTWRVTVIKTGIV